MNTSFWSTLNKYDKLKIAYAYIFSPLFIMASLGGSIQSDLYAKYGDKALGQVPCGAVFGLAMISYVPTILPSTLVRFAYFKRELNYGLEMYASMWIATVLSLILAFLMVGASVGTIGLLGTFAVYCVLSYKATGFNEIPKKERYGLTLLTLAIPFITFKILGTPQIPGIFFFYEAPFTAIMLNCHLRKNSNISSSASSERVTSPPHEPSHSNAEQQENTYNARLSTAIQLVNLGLATIGRKTQRTNLYFTPEREAERHSAERPFLRQLANKYTDTAVRKVLAKHFMLYKECCLFIIFSVLLKKDAELHDLVRTELTERLTDNLTPEATVRRKDYMYAFSRAFYEEYQRSKNLGRTLSFTFWSVLCTKHPELVREDELQELLLMDGLMAVYKYAYEAVKVGI